MINCVFFRRSYLTRWKCPFEVALDSRKLECIYTESWDACKIISYKISQLRINFKVPNRGKTSRLAKVDGILLYHLIYIIRCS